MIVVKKRSEIVGWNYFPKEEWYKEIKRGKEEERERGRETKKNEEKKNEFEGNIKRKISECIKTKKTWGIKLNKENFVTKIHRSKKETLSTQKKRRNNTSASEQNNVLSSEFQTLNICTHIYSAILCAILYHYISPTLK